MNISYRAHFVFPLNARPPLTALQGGVKLTPSLFTSNKIYCPLIPRAGLCVRSSLGLFVVLEWIIKLACCLCVPISPSMMNWRRQRRATGSSRRSISTSQPASRWWPRCTRLSCLFTCPKCGMIFDLSSTPPSGPSPCMTWRCRTMPTTVRSTSWRCRSRLSMKTQRWWDTKDLLCLIKYSFNDN